MARLLLVGVVPDGECLGPGLKLLDEFVGGEADTLRRAPGQFLFLVGL